MESFQKRLRALSAKVEQEGIILDENQVAALEKAKEEKQAHGEIETYYPGFLVAHDTYCVEHIKGVGHIYRQHVSIMEIDRLEHKRAVCGSRGKADI